MSENWCYNANTKIVNEKKCILVLQKLKRKITKLFNFLIRAPSKKYWVIATEKPTRLNIKLKCFSNYICCGDCGARMRYMFVLLSLFLSPYDCSFNRWYLLLLCISSVWILNRLWLLMCLRSNVLRCVFSVSYEPNDKKYQVIVIYAHTFIARWVCVHICVCGWTLTNNSHNNVMCVVYTIYRKVGIRLDARVHCMYSHNHEICDEFRTLYLVYQCVVWYVCSYHRQNTQHSYVY